MMQGQVDGIAFDMIAKTGQRLSFFCNASIKKDKQGLPQTLRTIIFDAGDRRLYEKELLAARRSAQQGKARLEYLAEHDSLTNLPNRHSFAIRLEEALVRARASNDTLAVMFVDLDRFKEVSDTWGHETGDTLLVEVARRFITHRRPNRTVARLGGEEFVFLLEGENAEQAYQAAEGILADLSQPFELPDAMISVGASIGIAVYPEAGASGQELMRNADRAMYTGKMSGGFRILVYTAETAAKHARENRLRQDLPISVKDHAFVLHYHAKISLKTGKVIGAEALLRWKHPDHEHLLYPGEFLHLIEASPVRSQVFEWTVEEVCRQLAQWEREDGLALPISINLSAWQLVDTKLPSMLAAVASKYGISVDRIELEITEGALISDQQHASEILQELARLGFVISLDDFGTGYSGLAYLKKFPISGIKIDKSFVQGLGEDAASRILAQAIVVFGKSVGLDVLAEGVETLDQCNFLASIGCDAIQGFLIARPLAGQAFKDFVLHYQPRLSS
jgi:diguanylate cyclase (GGDEF)-like protein